MMRSSAIPVLIFLIPFAAVMLLPFLKRKQHLCKHVASAALLVSTIFSAIALWETYGGVTYYHKMGGWTPPIGIEWRMDALSALMCFLVSFISWIVILATGHTVDEKFRKGRMYFYATALLYTCGLYGILMTHDLFNVFVFLEVSSLTTYALVATGDRVKGNVASLRYLFIGTIGASFYLFGVGYLYAATGTLNMSDMASRLALTGNTNTVLLGFFFIFIGLAIKMGLFPFHGWLPNAYTFASNPASALLAPLSTKVSIYLFIRIFYLLLGSEQMHLLGFDILLLTFGIAAMIYGSVKAYMQTTFKRLLAFSSISHIGLIITALGVNHPIAFAGAIFHIVFHAVMKALLFLCAGAIEESHGIKNIRSFGELTAKMPLTMKTLGIGAISMIGLPPLCGFFSKWYIALGSIQGGHGFVTAVIIFSGLLTAIYFFKVIELTFFRRPADASAVKAEAHPAYLTACIFLAGLICVLGFTAPYLFNHSKHLFFPLF